MLNLTKLAPSYIDNSADAFLADVLDLLTGRSCGNMGAWVYGTPRPDTPNDPVNGVYYHQRFVSENKHYYLKQSEHYLIQNYIDDMCGYLPDCATLIDLGPGNNEAVLSKTIPFVVHMKNLFGYIPVDLQQEYLFNAVKQISYVKPQIYTDIVESNFYNLSYQQDWRRPVMIFFGNTVANTTETSESSFPVNLSNKLSKIRSALGQGFLIVGQDINQDSKSLMKAYDNHYMKDFALNVFHRMRRDLPMIGFSPYEFDLEVKWHPENYNVARYAVATKSQIFFLNDQKIRIDCGQKFHLMSSYKYPIPVFQQAAIRAGFEPLDVFSDGKMAIHVLKAV